ncbi:MAG: hypothetical protein QGI78_08445 [Phycisphaerales bacterium]|jgi:hypothetical protein|nr:hypothetical protein [Phycisphaerales bacterium]
MNDRIAKLEQELNALKQSSRKWRGATVLLLVGAGLLAADAVGPTVIDHLVVRKLDVITDDGHAALSLAQSETGGQIDVYAADGTNLLRLGTNESGGDMAVWNREGKNVGGLWSSTTGGMFSLWNGEGFETTSISSGTMILSNSISVQNSAGIPIFIAASDQEGDGRLQVAEHDGHLVCELRTIAGVGGAIVLNTVEDKRVVTIAATDEGGSMNLMNARGVPVVIASTSDANGGALAISNERGITVVHASSDAEQRGALNISDDDGNGTRRVRPLRGYSP